MKYYNKKINNKAKSLKSKSDSECQKIAIELEEWLKIALEIALKTTKYLKFTAENN